MGSIFLNNKGNAMPRFFNFGNIIKIKNKKEFDDLTIYEIALMIDADSSLSPEGNDFFSSNALDEFIHNSSLKRDDLNFIKKCLSENIYLDIDGKNYKKINVDFLKRFSKELKSKSI